MAVHNGSPYLRTAMDSILGQTYCDFQFLIVDDASTDDTRETIRSYNDSRIQLLPLEQNVGQTAALNIGLRRASTQWIARMDADDYASPNRLEEQVRALDEDDFLACVGTFAWTFRHDPLVVDRIITPPADYLGIKRASLSELALIHGCIVVSREALLDIGAYDERYRYCADVEMFDRLLAKYRASNVPVPLMGLRYHEHQGSLSTRAINENIDIIWNRLLNYTKSPEEAGIVLASLSWVYLLRARRSTGDRHFLKILPDIWRALRASPRKFPWYIFKIFAIYNVPARRRAMVKGFLVRSIPGLSARW